MQEKMIHIGKNTVKDELKTVQGNIITIDEEPYYKISNFDVMPPFFMSITSDSDLWMFISSNGALTAGRRNPDHALFPYYTDDRIHDSHDITGSKTALLLTRENKTYLYEPFSSKFKGIYRKECQLYKNKLGNKIIFQEVNHDLSVCFQYQWMNCDKFGFIRKSIIKNMGQSLVQIMILDGILNILPYGADKKFQMEYSTLLDGYKRNELIPDIKLGLYTLSAIPTDKPEPSEALKVTAVWSAGFEDANILLSSTQLDAFRQGKPVKQETDIKGTRGAYLLNSEIKLQPDEEKEWYISADIGKNHAEISSLIELLSSEYNLSTQLEQEVLYSSEQLNLKIAKADGCQLTNDPANLFRHFSNTMFNIMRGGLFENNNSIDKSDFLLFIKTANQSIAQKYATNFNKMPEQMDSDNLIEHTATDHVECEKYCYEYLPLSFSRRHGDPSRPWNYFSIDIKDDQGNRTLNYQGNWRDIFQNWEALAYSFPGYIENMITKFVNASTADGYNPYRIMRDGFDWEVLDPNDAWSYIGYWGDHQIVYLLKLLELSSHYHPGKLESLLEKEIFTYSNVPYKIKSYQEILKDPKDTIVFDFDQNTEIGKRVEKTGTDGKLVLDKRNQIYHVNLTEKLLVPLLVKLSNFIPEAGIWLNTQRPEWNDANNALVGDGASMVTLCYLRRFITFCIKLFSCIKADLIQISCEVEAFFIQINHGLQKYQHLLNGPISDRDRKEILDILGQAGSDHRLKIYREGFSNTKESISVKDLISFFELVLKYIDHSINSNKRDDDLYHAYNLIKIGNKQISIRYLYEMLEGQVAILDSGFLSAEDSIILLNSLKKSALYREDQSSYILYPDRQLARFVNKNTISQELLNQSKILTSMAQTSDTRIINTDLHGQVHFSSKFRNARILKQTLQEMKNGLDPSDMDENEEQIILDIYESVFDHQSFTGRSGTFYKYEGLGSIYWHMVSKLLLAVQDTYWRLAESNVQASILNRLKSNYYEIREGIGCHKNPEHYGAIPTDPYSHTPKYAGAQQPGMTGQVKEDFISRFGELGVIVRDGKIKFQPFLINKDEFLIQSQVFQYFDVNNKKQTLILNPGMLGFTICQVPVIYICANTQKIIITQSNETEQEIEGLEIGVDLSKEIFQRKDLIKKIQVLLDI